MADPTCPACGLEGVDHILSKESKEKSKTRQPWFLVIYCEGCGHVYQVLAKHVFSVPVAPNLSLPKID
jgi:uncharacterized Zn finger protein